MLVKTFSFKLFLSITVTTVLFFTLTINAESFIKTKVSFDPLAAAFLIASSSFCKLSGLLGPKRKEGDGQVPEGFYYIEKFNPTSQFYLSLGINYPNQSDKIKSNFPRLGGDIYIHGKCVTIGCLPMTDDKIKEIYLYALYSKNCGQLKIPVYIFPFKMSEENQEICVKKYPQWTEFWKNLKQGYDIFEKERRALKISVDKKGNYTYKRFD